MNIRTLLTVCIAGSTSAFAPSSLTKTSRSACLKAETNGATATVSSPPAQKDLIDATESFMNTNGGYFSPIVDESAYADDFVFRGPVIGPLNFPDYVEVLDYLKVYEAFPDISPNVFGITVDPKDPYRVRFFVRATGTYQNKLGGAMGKLAKMVTKPDGREYVGSTEAWTLRFNEKLQVREVTAGYVVDLFEPDVTTQGKGLSFGILATLGLPMPNGNGNTALKVIQSITQPLSKTGATPKAYSDPEDVPDTWKSDVFGASSP